MRKKKKRGEEGGANWMDTYGDMVTLLLTFFVMLYSMSSLNQEKWEVFVKSIYSNASTSDSVTVNQEVGEDGYDLEGSLKVEEDQGSEIDIDKLYLTFAAELNKASVEGVTVSRGDGFTFLSFEDEALFKGNSSALTDQAKDVLDIFCRVLAPVNEQIAQVDIMGHTSQGDPNRMNTPRTDRMLSAMRAAEVTVYIQEKNVISPEKLISTSYGQFRPIDTFETREGRARNRRVEIILVDEGVELKSLNDYYKELASDEGGTTTVVTDGVIQDGRDGFAAMDAVPEVEANLGPDAPETGADSGAAASETAADGGQEE